ncbi:hypothetical protein [Flavobacterium humi]|uniref:Uncharacterized protein n=1 Tax=Flavobacterium humi TaxID=2562683 RepID=A0A4Z0L993_9FLAO|nr:hypothetical protein [Flavobacterium humi]TGD58361.1 hypothetical protein E4635_05465 [Flavobacterium humi]
MKQFLRRLFLFVTIPSVLLLGGYLYFDPFKVIYTYDHYDRTPVISSRDYISTEQYLKNKDKYHYNSFIFGSSRTIAFKTDTWKQYLDKDAVPYKFDASAESIAGIASKLKYLDKENAPIKNALIILCRDWSFTAQKNRTEHLFKKHPAVSGKSWLDFHFAFLKAYLNPRFLWVYYNYQWTGQYKDWMVYVIAEDAFTVDPVTNEMTETGLDRKIEKNPKQYVKDLGGVFYDRPEKAKEDSISRIDSDYLKMLLEMKSILEKHKTKYKIVAGPLYEQVKWNRNDKAILVKIFGNHFYDYTGKNKFTGNEENYYENSHYRPVVGTVIFEEIFREENKEASRLVGLPK